MNEQHKQAIDTLCTAASCFASEVEGATEKEIRDAVELIESWSQAQPDKVTLSVYFGYEFEHHTYEFDTLAEQAEFIRGMAESDGWDKFLTAEENETYEVIQQLIGGGWENTWHDEHEEPQEFASFSAAKRELKDHIETCQQRGMDCNPGEFKIVPVGHF